MLIKEYRIVLPLTVEEYHIGQLYSIAEASKNETGGGEGIEVLKNEPFINQPLLGDKFSSGQYTHKIFHLKSKVPPFIRLMAPKGSLQIHEEAWNAYPYCRTILRNPSFMKERFTILIESYHLPDRGREENVHELPPAKLKQREIVIIDIGNDPINPVDFKPSEDPSVFVSKRTGRGPLTGDWINTVKPVMTCYKLVTAEFRWFGLQNRIEQFIMKSERRIFTNIHRQIFCWIDRWHGLTMDDVRQIEEETQRQLHLQRMAGEVRGMKAETD